MVYLYTGQTHHATMCWNPIPIGNNEHVQPVKNDYCRSRTINSHQFVLDIEFDKNMQVWNFKGTSRYFDWL